VQRGDLGGVRICVRYGVLGLQGFRALDQFDADDVQFLADRRVVAIARLAAAPRRQMTKIFREGKGHKISSNPDKPIWRCELSRNGYRSSGDKPAALEAHRRALKQFAVKWPRTGKLTIRINRLRRDRLCCPAARLSRPP